MKHENLLLNYLMIVQQITSEVHKKPFMEKDVTHT